MDKKLFWRGFITGAIAFALLSVLAYNSFLVEPDISLNEVSVENLEGEKIALTSNIGKPLVVNYWATWCAPCKKEFPYFNEVKQQLGADVNFVMISDESTEKIKKFSTSNPYTFQYLKSDKKLATYGINALPTTYFYNASGILISKHTGELDIETLKTYIEKIK